MSRDRFADLQAARKGAGSSQPDLELGGNSLQVFQQQIDAIDNDVKSVRERLPEFDRFEQRARSAASDTDFRNIEKELARTTDSVNVINNSIGTRLKAMQADINARPNDSENQIRRNQHSAITRKFMETLTEYQNAQKRNRDAVKERFQRQYKVVNPNATEDEINRAMEENTTQSLFTNQLLDQTRNYRAKQALEGAQERQRDLQKVSESIVEIQQLFTDLQRMIESQGEYLDRIEMNVNNAEVQVTQADDKMRGAVDKAASARKKRICLFITFIIVLIIIIALLAYYFGVYKKNQNDSNQQ